MLRRALFSTTAVCIALAVGIALGNGPLQGRSDRAGLASNNRALSRQLADTEHAADYDKAMVTAMTGATIKGRLAQKVVTLMVLPGVDAATVTRTRADLQLAGAQVTTTATLRPGLVDAQKKIYVASVAGNTLKGVRDVESSSDSYQQIGALVARAYVAKTPGAAAFDKESVDIDAQIQGAGLLDTSADPARRGNLVVVLAGDDHGTSKAIKATRVIEQTLLEALLEGSDGLLLAAPPAADDRGGLLQSVRSDDALSDLATVNVLGSAAGRVTTVLAAAVIGAGGQGGRYGVVDGRSALPPGVS